LGWRNREVQLHRDGLQPPPSAEYIHAYCDFWASGRLEQALAAPVERAEVLRRALGEAPAPRLAPKSGCSCTGNSSSLGFGAHCKGWEFAGQTPWCYVEPSCLAAATGAPSGGTGSFGLAYEDCAERRPPRRAAPGSASPHVLVVVARGLGLEQSRAWLPRTLRTMAQFRRGGSHRGAAYSRFVTAGGGGEAAIRALVRGTPARRAARGAAVRSLWSHYADWGYVSAYGEAACLSGASRAAAIGLEGAEPEGAATGGAVPAHASAQGRTAAAAEAAADHVLIEPYCSLDAQLRARLTAVRADAAAAGGGGGGGGGRPRVAGCPGPSHAELTGPNRSAGWGDADCTRREPSGVGGGLGAQPLFHYMRAFLAPSLYTGVPKLAFLALPPPATVPAGGAAEAEAARCLSEVGLVTRRSWPSHSAKLA
jgi:hypothetical protein